MPNVIGPTFKYSAALSKNERVIKRLEILLDLASQGTAHLWSHSMDAVERSALQLLQQLHRRKKPSILLLPSKQ